MKKIIFVTSNKEKAKEAQLILDYPLEIVPLDLPEIQSLDIDEIVKKKAEEAYKILQKPLIVEDVGVYFASWNGFPGPLIKHLHKAGNDSYEMVIKMLEGFESRDVEVKAVIGYHDGEKVHIIEGSFSGKIVDKRGDKGWGFDPFVIPDGYDKTFGELPESLKNTISHRARALQNFKKFLENQKKHSKTKE